MNDVELALQSHKLGIDVRHLKFDDCRTIGGYGLPVYAVDIVDDTVYVSVWEFD